MPLTAALAAVALRSPSPEALIAGWEGSRDPDLVRASALLAAATFDASGSAGVLARLEPGLAMYAAAWACASAARLDVRLAPLLRAAIAGGGDLRRLGRRGAEARVESGPPRDALISLLATRDARWLAQRPRAHARLELAIWELGAAADSVPDFGAWLFPSEVSVDLLLLEPARRTLRHRVIAARTLLLAAAGFEERRVPSAQRGRVLSLVRALATHPEPLVWIPAVRALGRLAAHFGEARETIERWERSENTGERRRSITARASMPEAYAREVERTIDDVVGSTTERWALAAAATAGPDLAVHHQGAWERLTARLASDDAPLEAQWAAAQSLATLARRSDLDRHGRALADEIAARVRGRSVSGATDAAMIAAIERDLALVDRERLGRSGKLDFETAADWLVERYLRGEDVAQASESFAEELPRKLARAWTAARSGGTADEVGRALFQAESTARALAVAAWEGVETARTGAPTGRAATALDVFAGDVARHLLETDESYPIARLALRILALAADAHDDWSRDELPRRGIAAGRVAIAIARSPSFDEKKERKEHEKSIADALRRVIDCTRRTAAIEPEPVDLVRFALWWRLAGHDAAFLPILARSESLARDGRAELAIASVETLMSALSEPAAARGAFVEPLNALARAAAAEECALVESMTVLAGALGAAADALDAPTRPGVREALGDLVRAIGPMRAALASPEIALGPSPIDAPTDPQLLRWLGRALDLEPGHSLTAELDPMHALVGLPDLLATRIQETLGALLRKCVTPLSEQVGRLGGYVVERRLGGGGFGEALLVRDPETGARVVAKTVTRELEGVSHERRIAVDQALRAEMGAFPSLSPHVMRILGCNFFAEPPYVLMSYVPGVDLETWIGWKRLTLAELGPIVDDVCEGLADLHALDLVHRDVKPANILLRFDVQVGPADEVPEIGPQHRDVLKVREAIVIDVGIAWRLGDSTAAGGIEGALSPHHASPEHVEHASTPPTSGAPSARPDAVPTTAMDVYSLAATIYEAVTGATFFAEREGFGTAWARLVERPMDDAPTAARLDHLPELRAILHDATTIASKDRLTMAGLRARIATVCRS